MEYSAEVADDPQISNETVIVYNTQYSSINLP